MTKVKSGTVNEYQKQRRDQAKLKALDYLGCTCMYCESTDADVLKFVHRSTADKEFGISTGLTKAWETLRPELDKCVLICRDCAARGATPDEKPEATLEEKMKESDQRYETAGQEWHADVWMRAHNEWVDGAWPEEKVCPCEYCEFRRDGEELPPAYKLRVKDLKNWETEL